MKKNDKGEELSDKEKLVATRRCCRGRWEWAVLVKTALGIYGGKLSQDLLNKKVGIWDRRAENEGRKVAGHAEKDLNRSQIWHKTKQKDVLIP